MKTKKRFLLSTRLLCLALTLCLLSPAAALAASNAVKCKVTFNARTGDNNTSSDSWSKNSFRYNTLLLKQSKLTRKMKFSAKVYIDKKLLKNNGDNIGFSVTLTGLTESDDNFYRSVFVTGSYSIYLQKEGNDLKLYKYSSGTGLKPAGKLASLKESGSKYLITLNKIPASKLCYDYTKQKSDQKIPVTKKYYLMPQLIVSGNTQKKVSGNVYLDELTMKAGITQKVTFDKQDFNQVYADNLADSEKVLKLSLKKVG